MTALIVILFIFSLITASVATTIVVLMLRTRSKQRLQSKTILTEGTSAQAVINSIRQTNVQVDDQPEVLLDLTVTQQDGKVVHALVKAVIQIVNIPAFQKGSVIEVKYMTIDNEQKFAVVGSYMP
ncbi:hypothetical protein ACWGPW_08190 [Paenibacillus chitinolyticus]